MATSFYVKRIARSLTGGGTELNNTVDVFIRTIWGKDLRLRLIPGLDEYLTLTAVQDHAVSFYRLDRRLLAMSDKAELMGLDQAAMVDIGRQLCKNDYVKDLDMVFVNKLVGGISLPKTPEYDTDYDVVSANEKIMTVKLLKTGKHVVFGFNTSGKAMIERCGKRVSVISPMIAKELQRVTRFQYGKACRAYCSGFIV